MGNYFHLPQGINNPYIMTIYERWTEGIGQDIATCPGLFMPATIFSRKK